MVKLSPRLMAVCSLVKDNSRVADVGTDHGYIPVFLYQNAVIKSAVASDIHIGPLRSCERLVSQEMLCDVIKVCQSDGLENLSPNDFDTIIIAGMGGELITDILSKCTYINEKHIIVNPMTHPELVREFLYNNGFEIANDLIVKESKHCYSVFDAEFSGKVTTKSRIDYYLGNITDFTNKEYFIHLLNYLNNKSKSGEDLSDVITAVKEKI